LFNHNVFEAVGYLNMWDSAANELVNYAKENFAMDLSFELLTWARRGVFMYSSVHPKGFVLYDVAKKRTAQGLLFFVRYIGRIMNIGFIFLRDGSF
jgi:hypothetical protein